MDSSSEQQQHQQMSSQSLENMMACSKAAQQDNKKPRPQPEQAQKCPRCDSSNTKFCYYNNYSLSQPRYFCKSCRRYWTKGGTLRNVPVGGGCRKNKRSSSKRVQDQAFNPNPNPLLTGFSQQMTYDSSDLTLALARLQKGQMGSFDEHDFSILGSDNNILGNHAMSNNNNPSSTNNPGFLDALRNGFLGSQNQMQNLYYGYGNGDMGEVENGNSCGVGVSGEMMMPYDHQDISSTIATTQAVTVTTMKQEMCSGREQVSSESKVLWGFPWQLNNGDHHHTHMGEVDSGRASWNNGFTPSWHGVLNSPLM